MSTLNVGWIYVTKVNCMQKYHIVWLLYSSYYVVTFLAFILRGTYGDESFPCKKTMSLKPCPELWDFVTKFVLTQTIRNRPGEQCTFFSLSERTQNIWITKHGKANQCSFIWAPFTQPYKPYKHQANIQLRSHAGQQWDCCCISVPLFRHGQYPSLSSTRRTRPVPRQDSSGAKKWVHFFLCKDLISGPF